MTKHSSHERDRRAAETDRMNEIQAAWYARIPGDVRTAFAAEVEHARARGPIAPPPDQAPGTAPNPPRPGREPKVAKDDRSSRRSRG